MKKALVLFTIFLSTSALAACGQPEWEEERELGIAAQESGDIDKAIKHYKKAVKLKPDYSEAKEDLEKAKQLYYEDSREIQRKIDEKREKEEEEKIGAWISGFSEGSVEKDAAPIIFNVFGDSYSLPSEIVSKLEYDKDEETLSITVKGKDGWSEDSIGAGFYEDSTDVYRELSKDDRIKSVWLTITFPIQGTYGNVEVDEVMVTWMSRETMDKVNWKSFDYKNLLDVVDGKRIYPQFVQ